MPRNILKRRSVITSPYPKPETVRKILGVSKKDGAFIEGLADGIRLVDKIKKEKSKNVRGVYIRGLILGLGCR